MANKNLRKVYASPFVLMDDAAGARLNRTEVCNHINDILITASSRCQKLYEQGDISDDEQKKLRESYDAYSQELEKYHQGKYTLDELSRTLQGVSLGPKMNLYLPMVPMPEEKKVVLMNEDTQVVVIAHYVPGWNGLKMTPASTHHCSPEQLASRIGRDATQGDIKLEICEGAVGDDSYAQRLSGAENMRGRTITAYASPVLKQYHKTDERSSIRDSPRRRLPLRRLANSGVKSNKNYPIPPGLDVQRPFAPAAHVTLSATNTGMASVRVAHRAQIGFVVRSSGMVKTSQDENKGCKQIYQNGVCITSHVQQSLRSFHGSAVALRMIARAAAAMLGTLMTPAHTAVTKKSTGHDR